MSQHTQGIEIIEAIRQLLAEVPGTLKDHQQRINSTQFLIDRLERLHDLETAANSDAGDEHRS